MQSDAEPFLQRIRAFPDDDVPRLIFADWLDEQARWLPAGRRVEAAARAELIRVQIALARIEEPLPGARVPADDPRTALQVNERALLAAHRDEWEAPFRGLATGPEFHRGFVEKVNVDARHYLRHAHELFAAGPIRHIHLLEVGSSLHGVVQSAYLSRLRALTVWAQHAGERLTRTIARSPHLAGLRALNLGRNRLGDEAADQLAGSATLAHLEDLDLSENDVGETGARALAASPHLGNLRRLELRHNQIGPAGAEALAGSDRLAKLERLGLGGNDVGMPRLYSLARAPDLLRVPVLDLAGNGLTASGLKAILAVPSRPGGTDAVRLRELDLGQNDLGDPGRRVLAECPHLAELRLLRLTACQIGDEGARALARSPHLNRLVLLDLGNNPINDSGFDAFLRTPYFRHLRKLIPPAIGVSQRMWQQLDHRFHRPPVRY